MTAHQKNLNNLAKKYAEVMDENERHTIHNAILKCKELDGIFKEFLEYDAEAVADKVQDSLVLCEEIDSIENMHR